MNSRVHRLPWPLAIAFGFCLLTVGAGPLRALDFNPFQTSMLDLEIHGFASEGFLASTKYNYLGDTTRGSFNFTELGLNASFNPFPHTRVAAQVFSFDVGQAGKYDLALDYALIEYTFNEYFGIRGGRIRRPEGIYNDIQDIDLTRTSVLLPQGMYDTRFRDFYLALDGGEFFGTIPLRTAGSLSYELYGGVQHPQLDGGLALEIANLPPYYRLVELHSPKIGGGQLWWNTPWKGLRAGVALNYDRDLVYKDTIGIQSNVSAAVQHYSLEYIWNSWTFQAEYYRSVDYDNISGGGAPNLSLHVEPESWYAGASYRFNKWMEVGTYHSEYFYGAGGPGAVVPSDNYQKDTALSLRFDVKESWIFKIEGHYILGTGQLYDAVNNPTRGGGGWWLIALKVTYSF